MADNVNTSTPHAAVTPVGLNHLVLNVRNMEESHRFWTETVGFRQVGELHATPKRPNPPKMRFYSGDHGGGALSHHDIALIENPESAGTAGRVVHAAACRARSATSPSPCRTARRG